MEIDQVIFKKAHRFYKKLVTKIDEDEVNRTVFLEPLKPRLTILARALTGNQNEIITSEREGGWSGFNFYLPESISFNSNIDDNIDFYLYRVLYLSVQQKLQLNWVNEDYNTKESQAKSVEHSQEVLDNLFNEYPNIYLTSFTSILLRK